MRALVRLAPGLIAVAAVCLAASGALAATGAQQPVNTPTVKALLRSRELWATIDVCNAPDQPDTVGIRGSMPGDGKAADKMYMNFSLEYVDAVNQWAALPSSESGWVLVGSGSGARQGG